MNKMNREFDDGPETIKYPIIYGAIVSILVSLVLAVGIWFWVPLISYSYHYWLTR